MSDDLVAFLRARLDEDEEYAQGPFGGDDGYAEYNDPGAPGHHLRVLAEVDAKRRIIDEHTGQPVREFDSVDGRFQLIATHPTCPKCRGDGSGHAGRQDSPCRTLRLLALPHAGHPDYQKGWTP